MNLIFDGNNLCHVHFHGNKGADDESFIPMTFMTMLNSMKFIYNKFKPQKVVIAFDESSWRKLYTSDLSKCVTYKKYKGTRRQNKTPSELKRLSILDENIIEMKNMFEQHTAVLTLSGKYLEADDLIAGFVQSRENEEHIIVSSDKDFRQLISENVKLYNPVENEFRTLDEWDGDAKLFMMEKCFRGDTGDWVMSSYPRIQQKKIFQAYKDDFLFNNLMNHEFNVEIINEHSGELEVLHFTTKDVYDENIHLMDLHQQPEYIRELIDKTIDNAITNNRKLSGFNFLKFCGKYKLVNIAKQMDSFTPLLNS